MNKATIKAVGFAIVVVGAGSVLTGCAHYREESGRKTEFNSDKGKFETSDYASVGVSSKHEPRPVSASELKKAGAK